MRRLIDVRGVAPEYCTTVMGAPRLRMLPGAIVMCVSSKHAAAAGVPISWELFEVLGAWPSATARSSWVKVVNLEVVRETPSELRLRTGTL